MDTRQPPIGWWLRRLDELITEALARTLGSFDLDRASWQVLNLVAEREPVSVADVRDVMASFANVQAVDSVGEALADRGWIALDSQREFTLTEAGRVAHDDVLNHVRRERARVADGVSRDDYAKVLATLQRMVENLEAQLDGQPS